MIDERDERANTILSNNKIGNNNIFVAIAPVVCLWGTFILVLLLIGMVTYAITDNKGFLAFMPHVFTWTITGAEWFIGLVTVLFALRFIIKHIFGGLADVLAAFIRAIEPLRRDRVHFANDNFVATTGNINVTQREDTRFNYNIKQIEGPEEPLLLPEPVAKPIPTARQLLSEGTVEQVIKNGHLILGYLDDGTMKTLEYDLLYSTDLGGVGGSGKTRTALWLCVQEIIAGTKLIVVDPHLHVVRRGQGQGLGRLLAPYKFAYHFPPCDDDPDAIIQRARWMRDECTRRKKPGVNLDNLAQVMMVIDEFNTVMNLQEIREELGAIIATVQREGRKLGLFFLLVGHRWSQKDIGNVDIRTNAATVIAHYYNDADQADKLLAGDGKKCTLLKSGSYWIRGLMTGDLCKVTTPRIEEDDNDIVLRLMGQVVDADPLPGHFRATSEAVPEIDKLNNGNRDGKRAEVDITKLALMRGMVADERSQNEIITELFAGMRNSEAIAEYRRYLAALISA